MKDLLINSMMLLLKEHCFDFAKWAFEQKFEDADELAETFEDCFCDCKDDLTKELEETIADAEQVLDQSKEYHLTDDDYQKLSLCGKVFFCVIAWLSDKGIQELRTRAVEVLEKAREKNEMPEIMDMIGESFIKGK